MHLKRKIFAFLLFIFFINPSKLFISKFEASEINKETISNKKTFNIKNNYLLGPGDIIEIIFFGADEFSGKYSILKDGFVYLPVIGSVNLSGISIDKSAQLIQSRYTNELLRPQVQINLLAPRAIQISLIGEVSKKGIYKIKTENNSEGNFSRITDAIKLAGGITEYANIKEIEVIRQSGENDYPLIKTTVDLNALITKGDTSQNLILFDGDVIKIPKANPDSSLDIIANSNLNDSDMKVYVIGEVKQPGEIILDSNTTLIDAILNAGGPIRWRGNTGNVRLIRFEKNGTLSSKNIKLSLNPKIANKDNPKLINGDIVQIRSSALASVSDALSIVAKPIQSVVNIFALGKILND